jgi:hypothetical protein
LQARSCSSEKRLEADLQWEVRRAAKMPPRSEPLNSTPKKLTA